MYLNYLVEITPLLYLKTLTKNYVKIDSFLSRAAAKQTEAYKEHVNVGPYIIQNEEDEHILIRPINENYNGPRYL